MSPIAQVQVLGNYAATWLLTWEERSMLESFIWKFEGVWPYPPAVFWFNPHVLVDLDSNVGPFPASIFLSSLLYNVV